MILVYEGLLKGAWVTQSSYIVEKSMSAWVTIMKVSSLKLPEPACQQFPGRVSFPQEGYWSHSHGGKVFFLFYKFQELPGPCVFHFLSESQKSLLSSRRDCLNSEATAALHIQTKEWIPKQMTV